jgi:hypothetical protein
MPSKRFVNITQQVIGDLSAAPFGCYRRTTRRSWKNLRGRIPVTLRGAPCWTVRKSAFPSRAIRGNRAFRAKSDGIRLQSRLQQGSAAPLLSRNRGCTTR